MAEVQVVVEQVECPKELNDVRLAVKALVEAIVAKKSISEIVSAELPLAIAAVDGSSQLGAEVQDPRLYNVIALLGADVAKALIPKKA